MSSTANPLYEQLVGSFKAAEPDTALYTQREKAFEQFKEKGFPTIKDEDWRFTNIAPYLRDGYALQASGAPSAEVISTLLAETAIEGWDAYRVVLINGSIVPALSTLPTDAAVTVRPLVDVIHTEVFDRYAGRHLQMESYPFAAINTAFFRDGLFVEVKKGAKADKPLHIVHLFTADVPVFFQPRHLVVLHSHAELHFMESTACTKGNAAVLVNNVLECAIEEGARLTHYVLQSGRKGERIVSHTQVSQAASSRYDNVTLSVPEADLIRNQLQVTLDGSGSECHLYGLYLPNDGQLIDNHTVVDHRYPHCESNELYKGVLQGSARAVFNGKIFVRRIAQKTNAFQQNNNLLLGDKALVHSKPQLEIFADDVKCSHGSTIGQFNPESLFYLRARGIGEEMAKELLVQAFGADITDRVSSDAVQKHLEKHLSRRPVTDLQHVPHVEHI